MIIMETLSVSNATQKIKQMNKIIKKELFLPPPTSVEYNFVNYYLFYRCVLCIRQNFTLQTLRPSPPQLPTFSYLAPWNSYFENKFG